MNPEKLVASLELSQEYALLMKEKGRELPESYFWWFSKENPYVESEQQWLAENPYNTRDSKICPALTSGEIGEMLPECVVNVDGLDFHLRTKKHKSEVGWLVKYVGRKGSGTSFRYNSLNKGSEGETAPTEADARLKMLNYLLANDLV